MTIIPHSTDKAWTATRPADWAPWPCPTCSAPVARVVETRPYGDPAAWPCPVEGVVVSPEQYAASPCGHGLSHIRAAAFVMGVTDRTREPASESSTAVQQLYEARARDFRAVAAYRGASVIRLNKVSVEQWLIVLGDQMRRLRPGTALPFVVRPFSGAATEWAMTRGLELPPVRPDSDQAAFDFRIPRYFPGDPFSGADDSADALAYAMMAWQQQAMELGNSQQVSRQKSTVLPPAPSLPLVVEPAEEPQLPRYAKAKRRVRRYDEPEDKG